MSFSNRFPDPPLLPRITPPSSDCLLQLRICRSQLHLSSGLLLAVTVFFSPPHSQLDGKVQKVKDSRRWGETAGAATHTHQKRKQTTESQVVKEGEILLDGGKKMATRQRREQSWGTGRKKCARVKDCKILDFLLIIPPPLRFNYSPSELSVRLQVWPRAERPLHPITQFDLLTFHLFSNHDMTFQVCQVRAIPALRAAPHPTHRGGKAPHCINHSDIVIASHFYCDSVCRFVGKFRWFTVFPSSPHPSLPLSSYPWPSSIPMVTASYWGIVFVGKSSGPILEF